MRNAAHDASSHPRCVKWMVAIGLIGLAGGVCGVSASTGIGTAVEPPIGATHWVLHQDHVVGGRWYEVLSIDAGSNRIEVRHDGLRESIALTDVLALISRSAMGDKGTAGRVVLQPKGGDGGAPAHTVYFDDQEGRTPRAVLESVAGIRLFGAPGMVNKGGSDSRQLRWEHDLLGSVLLDLSSIARVRLRPAVAWPTSATADGIELDVLRLANGDVISGFVDGWAEPVPIETADGRRIEIGSDRIGAIRFGNPTVQASGMRLWMRSGEVLPCDRLVALDRDSFRVVLSRIGSVGASQGNAQGSPSSLARSDVQGVVLDSAAFVGLADLPLLGVASGSGDGFGTSVSGPPMGTPVLLNPGMPAGLSGIEIQGPGAFRFGLPAGATRFACEVEVPAAARLWADLDLVIGGVGSAQDAYRVHIAGDRSPVSLDVPISDDGSGSLVIRIESAGRGPILDVVQLWFPRVLVGG